MDFSTVGRIMPIDRAEAEGSAGGNRLLRQLAARYPWVLMLLPT